MQSTAVDCVATYLGVNDFTSYLDNQNYNDFVKFHNYFWNEIAYLADDDD